MAAKHTTKLPASGRLVRRLALTFAAVVASAALLLGIVGLVLNAKVVNRDWDDKLSAMAEVTALSVNGDVFATLKTEADAARPEFKQLQTLLNEVLKARGLAYSYTVVLSERGYPQLVVDGSEEPEPIGTEYDDAPQPELKAMYETGKPQLTPVHTDEYGEYKTAYAPIRNSQGQIVGAVALDLAALSIVTTVKESAAIYVGALAAVILFGLLIGRGAAGRIAARVTPMATAARSFAAGDLTAGLTRGRTSRKPDEVDDLQTSLLAMQQNLTGLVVELRDSAARVVASATGLSAAVETVSGAAAQADEAMGQVSGG
ncbi:MAG TPA: hypothetical protein VNT01_06865, partial [Symbiobacteriaceae bacterium]|nr:hypothetical protein [Symbiobacteriaceae bacterium]